MSGTAILAVRVANAAALATTLAFTLGGCGYREIKAPCGPEEGAPPALAYARSPVAPVTGSPLNRLGVNTSSRDDAGGIPVADTCGPLRPINSGASSVGRPP